MANPGEVSRGASMNSMARPEDLTPRLEVVEEVLFAFLFGSRSTGRARSDSDWDLGVYLAESLTPRERHDLRLKLQAELAELGSIDVTVLNDAPPLLAQRALQGKRLMVKDPVAFVRFFVRSEALAGDERFWRQLHMAARARRIEDSRFGRP